MAGWEGQEEQDDEDDIQEELEDSEEDVRVIAAASPHGARVLEGYKWADVYIFNARRESARKTEESVLRIWQAWVTRAIAAGDIVDIIVDAHHTILYLKYSATRALLNRKGMPVNNNQRLSAASLKKHMTMLGRLRRRQCDDDPSLDRTRPAVTTRTLEFYNAVMIEADRARFERDDFDVTHNTILDSHIFPHHFEQIKRAILVLSTQLPSIIKADFCWNWQCTTLTRGDELVTLPLSCLQPHTIYIPDYVTPDGRRGTRGRYVFGVLSLYHQTKTAKPGQREPNYNFVLPHRDPLRCPIGSLAIALVRL